MATLHGQGVSRRFESAFALPMANRNGSLTPAALEPVTSGRTHRCPRWPFGSWTRVASKHQVARWRPLHVASHCMTEMLLELLVPVIQKDV